MGERVTGARTGTALLAVFAASAVALAMGAPAAGHSGHSLGEFASPVVDGAIGPNEYQGSCEDTILSSASTNYEITVCEANDETNDYWAVRIGDLTEDSSTTPAAGDDTPIIWFDNNHDGFVQPNPDMGCGAYGSPVEDWFGFVFNNYLDSFYCFVPPFSGGYGDSGPFDGAGVRDFDAAAGWTYEFAHPLDSGDPDDYELGFGDTAGWCLTYDDGSNPTNAFAAGEIQFPLSCHVDFASANGENGAVKGRTLNYGDVEKESELQDQYEALRRKLANLKAGCKPCPPPPKDKLRAKINEVLEAYRAENQRAAVKRLGGVLRFTGVLLADEEYPVKKGERLIDAIDGFRQELQTPGPQAISAPGQGGTPGAAHVGRPFEVGPDGQPPPREPRPFGR